MVFLRLVASPTNSAIRFHLDVMRGVVPTAESAGRALRIAAWTPGVRDVSADLTVDPAVAIPQDVTPRPSGQRGRERGPACPLFSAHGEARPESQLRDGTSARLEARDGTKKGSAASEEGGGTGPMFRERGGGRRAGPWFAAPREEQETDLRERWRSEQGVVEAGRVLSRRWS